jgi:Dyp-type peroxidase family
MFLIPGVDTKQNERVILFKIDIPSNERPAAIEFLSRACARLKQLSLIISFERNIKAEDESQKPTALFGFSARFFKGPLTNERDRIKRALRFNIDRPVPLCLRQMNAREDNRFPELASQGMISAKESDILIKLEFSEPEIADVLLNEFKTLHGEKKIILKSAYQGFLPKDGMSSLGVKEGISNLQDMRASQPDEYKSHIFIQDGEAGDHAYDGGSYIVFRKYNINVERWSSDSLVIKDNHGKEHYGEKARNLAMGRSAENSLVIDGKTNKCLEPEFDEKQGVRTFAEAHIKHCNPRGQGSTSFGFPVSVKNVRILRRSFFFKETDPGSGKTIDGLLFLCFQKDIQKHGFELIHNEWLMSQFLGGRDRLLDPESGIVEPVDGCYYFCPLFSEFPGDVFFDVAG